MKKQLLTLSALITLSSFGWAQQTVRMQPSLDLPQKHNGISYSGNEAAGPVNPNAPLVRAVSETSIGETFYDLQSNNGMQNRLINHGNGELSAVWTFSFVTDPWADRGTGYNYRNGTSWGTPPSTRIETLRTGWPTLLKTGGGKEIIISHSGVGGLVKNTRTTPGTGSWNQNTIPTNTGFAALWPRAATGGTNNNSLHVIFVTDPQNGNIYKGLEGALVYSRSLDEGLTWDIQDSILPGLDTSSFIGFGGDAYSIAANGNNVAIALFNQTADLVLMKSTDNGDTWTKTTVMDFPIDKWRIDDGSDINNDGTYDTLNTNDAAGTLIVDDNGMAHLFFGAMRILDADLTDASFSFFPGTNGLLYWNETMGTDGYVTIAGAEDVDGDGALGGIGIPLYYASLAGMPTAGMNADGTLFLAYASYMENFDNGAQNYRHIYMMKSSDNGNTWTSPVDVTPDPNFDFYECIFPAMASLVDNKVRVIYQRDYEPGLSVRGDLDVSGQNDIIYLEVDTALTQDVSVLERPMFAKEIELFPNPGNGLFHLVLHTDRAMNVELEVVNLLGEIVLNQGNVPIYSGKTMLNIDLSAQTQGIYFVRLRHGDQQESSKLLLQK